MAAKNGRPTGSFPEGAEYNTFVKRRQRIGKTWHGLFFAATLVGILALVALLIDVIDDAFGYVAIQSKVPETVLVTQHFKQQMLDAPRTLTSEDDQVLVDGIAARSNAIGFFGYSFYQNNADKLTLVAVDGVQPDETSVESGEYLLSRPLFIYTTQEELELKPQVAAFVNYYLNNVNQQILEIGYFPVSDETLQESQEQWERATAGAVGAGHGAHQRHVVHHLSGGR